MKNAFLFALSVGGLSMAQPGVAATLYESAPATVAGFGSSYVNSSTDFNFLAKFTLTTAVQVTSFDIVTSAADAAVGGDVVFKLLDSSSLFTLGGQINSLSSFQGSDQYFWASTSFSPITLAAGTYWIGMSGLDYSLDWASTLAPGISNEAYALIGEDFVDFTGDGVADPVAINFAFRVSGEEVQQPIPEPSSWLMMIAGFGLAGAMLRRRSIRFQTA